MGDVYCKRELSVGGRAPQQVPAGPYDHGHASPKRITRFHVYDGGAGAHRNRTQLIKQDTHIWKVQDNQTVRKRCEQK